MGYEVGGIGMGAQFHVEDADIGTWLEGDLLARAVLAPLADSGVLEAFRWLSGWNVPMTQLASVEAILERSRSWRHGVVELTTSPCVELDDDPDGSLTFNPHGAGLNIGLALGGELLASRRATLLDDCTRWVRTWEHGLGPKVRLVAGSLSPYATAYPRAMPPRFSRRWFTGALIHHLGVSYWRDQDADEAAAFERLLFDPLPEGATRIVEGDVLTLQFIDRLDDAEAIAHARRRHEAWVLERVDSELERGWNEAGDRID